MENKHIYIDGPTNIYRIEGSYAGIKKILYLFLDIHEPVQNQTKCRSFDSIPIANFIFRSLKDNFSSSSKNEADKLDLFFEINQEEIKLNNGFDAYNEKYIHNFVTMFQQMATIKEKSKLFSDVRLHYIDHRAYLFSTMKMYINNVNNMFDKMTETRTFFDNDIDNIQDILNMIIDFIDIQKSIIINSTQKSIQLMDEQLDILNKELELIKTESTQHMISRQQRPQNMTTIKSISTSPIDIDSNEIDSLSPPPHGQSYKVVKKSSSYEESSSINVVFDHIKKNIHYMSEIYIRDLINTIHFFRKLMTKFTHKSMEDYILNKLVPYFLEKSDNIKKLCLDMKQDIITGQNKISETYESVEAYYGIERRLAIGNFIHDMNNKFAIIDEANMSTYVLTMDIYFIKRFLDKDYINRGLVYTGQYHSINYLYYLIKHFDFNITHCNNLPESTETINKKIKKASSMEEVYEILMTTRFHVQCSDMKGFPKNFT